MLFIRDKVSMPLLNCSEALHLRLNILIYCQLSLGGNSARMDTFIFVKNKHT